MGGGHYRHSRASKWATWLRSGKKAQAQFARRVARMKNESQNTRAIAMQNGWQWLKLAAH